MEALKSDGNSIKINADTLFNSDKSELNKNLLTRVKFVSNSSESCKKAWIYFRDKGKELISTNRLSEKIKLIKKINEFTLNYKIGDCIVKYNDCKKEGEKIRPEHIGNPTWINNFLATIDEKNQDKNEISVKCHLYSKYQFIKFSEQLVSNCKKLQALLHRDYHPENNQLYPFRLDDGSNYKLKYLSETSLRLKDGRKFRNTEVKKFVSSKTENKERGELYDKFIHVNKIGEDYQYGNYKEDLTGDYGVFAKEDIPAGTCLGVYGGTVLFVGDKSGVLSEKDYKMINMDYFVDMSHREDIANGKVYLDGDNILSKVNSIFIRGNGEWEESKTGFNADFVAFDAEMIDGKKLRVQTLFTSKEIKKGEEIRASYGYDKNLVQQAMITHEAVKNENLGKINSEILKIEEIISVVNENGADLKTASTST